MRGSTTHDTNGLQVDLLEQYHPHGFQIRLWDGRTRQTDPDVDSKYAHYPKPVHPENHALASR